MGAQGAGSVGSPRESVVEQLSGLHKGEETVYTGCVINCGAGHCILKVRKRDGVITAIEPDDHYNPGVGREDRALSDMDLIKNRLQVRGCPMGWMWHKLISAPDRILHPLKRAEGSRRGEGKYQRISWDEALDLVAGTMKETVEKHGLYSITTAYQPSPYLERLFGLWGAGVEGWGWCSMDPERLSVHLMAGVPGWAYANSSNDMADILMNSEMVVLWGFEPTVTHLGPGHQLAYYIRMTRERGKPVICIDPRYTVAAEVLADQWIPIKPGTDIAMMLAVAHVLITEELYNKEFVEKYVDPVGFEEWRAYVLGKQDGTPKTPEWAEKVCAVPAATIRGFARLYASKKPTWLWKGWGTARKSRGENVARAAGALQAIMGYWGVAGGSIPFTPGSRPRPAVMLPYGEIPKRMVPKMYRSQKWAQMVLLLDKVRSGEMSVEEYKARVGWRAPARPTYERRHLSVSGAGAGFTELDRGEGNGAEDGIPLPNPKMLMGGGTWLHNTRTVNNAADATRDTIEAMERMEFTVWIHSHMSPALYWADVILPVADQSMEDRRIGGGAPGYGGFTNITYVSGVVPPPGEARPAHWIYSELARRLGIGEQYNRYYTGTWEDWWETWDRYLQDEYERGAAELSREGGEAPRWEEFKRDCLINVEEFHDRPYHGFEEFIDHGKPLLTRSGKIELYNYVIADESGRGKLHVDDHRRLIDNLPNDWRDLPPIPAYQKMYRGMDHADVSRFPLMLLTSYPRYRNHTAFWNVPWLRGDCYRHAIWMNPADARARGVSDGDLARVVNDKGVAVIPAYVTSRLLPGMVVIHHGGSYQPDKEGVDWGCTPNIFLTDPESPVTAPHVTNLVQVEKWHSRE